MYKRSVHLPRFVTEIRAITFVSEIDFHRKSRMRKFFGTFLGRHVGVSEH